VRGGALHRLLARLRLLGDDGLPEPRAALAAGTVAWLVGAVLAAAEAWLRDAGSLLGYFVDASTYAHALVALPVLVGIERAAERRLAPLLDHPLRHGLVTGSAAAAYGAAVQRADTRTSVAAVDFGLLLAAVAICTYFARYALSDAGPEWKQLASGGGATFSAVGAWMHHAVGTALVFLTLRWLWRFLAWTLLLAELARLPLELAPSHPDRAGGLGFLTVYPSLFYGLVVGVGAALGAELLNATLGGDAGLDDVARAVAIWLVAVLVVFVGPLLLFWPRLVELRDVAMLDLGGRSLEDNRRWREADAAAINARNVLFDRAAQIQPMLVSRTTVGQLLTVALLPTLPALATLVPLQNLLDLFVGGLK
jgi:hypothetical protein